MRSVVVGCALVAGLTAVGPLLGGCGGVSPAADFCSSYGQAMTQLVRAAKSYEQAPAEFSALYESTKTNLARLRASAPTDDMRRAFDTAQFTFSVFSQDSIAADVLSRADWNGNAVVISCAEYGVELTIR